MDEIAAVIILIALAIVTLVIAAVFNSRTARNRRRRPRGESGEGSVATHEAIAVYAASAAEHELSGGDFGGPGASDDWSGDGFDGGDGGGGDGD